MERMKARENKRMKAKEMERKERKNEEKGKEGETSFTIQGFLLS